MMDVWARVGLRRKDLKQLGMTWHRLALLDPRGAWLNQAGAVVQKPGSGGNDPFIGHEIDVVLDADVSRGVSLTLSGGLLFSGPKAREAGFAPLAHQSFASLDYKW